MSRAGRPPQGAAWVWVTRELLESDAWKSASVSCRRLLDFLMIEHMKHGGRANGRLKAPHRQLAHAGIHPSLVSKAIQEAERRGLVVCHRGGQRVASSYALAWLPLFDGTPATDGWRTFAASGDSDDDC